MADRAQTFTLEAFIASLLLLATLAFALQAVAISPNTSNPAATERRNEHAGLAAGVLDQTAANGSLQATLLAWDARTEVFLGTTDEDHYIARAPSTTFGHSLEAMFGGRQVRYNVDLYYPTPTGDRGHQPLIEWGTPSDEAVRVIETVTLYDQTRLVDENETKRSVTLADIEADGNRSFYAADMQSNGEIYTVIRVEVVLWKS